MKTTQRTLALAACGLLTLTAFSQVHAAPIDGSIGFFGSATAGPSGPGTLVDFNTNWIFLAGTGSYSGILFSTPTLFNDFSFTGDGTSAVLTAPLLPLWSLTFGGNIYTFDLLSLTSGHVEQGSMAFTGTGVLHATGFDDTIGSFGLTGSGTNFVYTLSFETNAAVPEPASAVLVGIGLALAGAATYLRRRRN